jgi:hypothetical protein
MSENNEPELIITNPEVVAPEPYDFEFVANAFGLIPYQARGLDGQPDYQGAFSPGAIVNIEVCDDGDLAVTLLGGFEIVMSVAQFTRLEKQLRDILKARQSQPMIVGIPPQGRRFQQ